MSRRWLVTTEKERTSPRRWRFISNCIVFKVQQFMYRNTAVLSSAPRRKQEGEQKKGTNPGEQSEQEQNTEIKENIRTTGRPPPDSEQVENSPCQRGFGKTKEIQETFSTGGEPPPCCAAVAPATEALEDTVVLLDRRRRKDREGHGS